MKSTKYTLIAEFIEIVNKVIRNEVVRPLRFPPRGAAPSKQNLNVPTFTSELFPRLRHLRLLQQLQLLLYLPQLLHLKPVHLRLPTDVPLLQL